MGSNRVHQLSGGLYVSGAPEQYKEKPPTMTSTAVPYTGGDIKKSGELGKMFDINVDSSKMKKSGPINNANLPIATSSSTSGRAGSSFRTSSSSNSGPLNPPPPPQITHLGSFSRPNSNSGPLSKSGEPRIPHLKTSGPLSRQNSGPLTPNLPATGLITSGPVSSGSASRNHSGNSFLFCSRNFECKYASVLELQISRTDLQHGLFDSSVCAFLIKLS